MDVIECPQCGASARSSDRKCSYCKAEFFITSLAYIGGTDVGGIGRYLKHYKQIVQTEPNNTEGLLGLGLCYLQMNSYLLAEKYFEQVIEASPEVSQAYYYCDLARIKGRRLMSLSLNEVRQLENNLTTAIHLEGGGIPQYKLLLAMIKRDYYETNGMRIPPPRASELLKEVFGLHIDKNELYRLRECVRVDKEEQYYDVLAIV